ncbi:hypothetical protein Ae717Ps2_7173 [Pseudonocardia sp. Ae717_Ps2]|nr:hypothetical protein Ae717Ps2_7173 [Pseudonocardia sp. Ae717_Ps2]
MGASGGPKLGVFPKETPCRRYDDDAAEHGGWLRGLQDHVMHRCGGAVVRWCGGAVVHLILIWVSDGLWSEDAPALVCGLAAHRRGGADLGPGDPGLARFAYGVGEGVVRSAGSGGCGTGDGSGLD